MRNVFLKKSYSKCYGEARYRPFYKKSTLKKSLDWQPEILQSLFLLYIQVKINQNKLNLKYWLPSFTLHNSFYKAKRGLKLVFLLICGMIFAEKCFPRHILSTDQFSLPDNLYFLRYYAICALQLLVVQSSSK